jgi:hypothetical protein
MGLANRDRNVADRLAYMKFNGWRWHGFNDFDDWVTRRPWLKEALEIKLDNLRAGEERSEFGR